LLGWSKRRLDATFPEGERAAELLQTGRISDGHPFVIGVGEDEYWNALDPDDVTTLEIPNDGHVSTGTFAGTTVLQLWNPTDVTVTRLLAESRTYMDLAMRGLKLTRPVGGDTVRITSLGEATTESQHVDRWGRPWQVRTWQIPFADSVLISYALPLPRRCASLIQLVPRSLLAF